MSAGFYLMAFALLSAGPALAQVSTKKPANKLLPSKSAVPWAPADVDASVPPVVPGIPCALPQLLEAVGQRAQELVANLERFTAIERIEDAKLRRSGKWGPTDARSNKYLAFISEVRPGHLSVEERREVAGSTNVSPAPVAGIGLTAFALIFHPFYAGDFQMVCEGLGDWQGHLAWQIHFAQRADRLPRFHSFVANEKRYNVKLKGRAWVNADNFQVTHMDVDLLEPVAPIRLVTEHMAIEYHPVHFTQRGLDLWLPESASLYVDFKGNRLRLHNTLSRYLLFSVQTSQEIADKP